MPMAICTSPIPSMRSWLPKVKRCLPVVMSMPIVPTKRPKTAMIKALSMEPCARKVRTVSPRHMRAKYSGAPKVSAASTRGGAKKERPRTPMVPAIKELKAAIPKAGPALPCRAI